MLKNILFLSCFLFCSHGFGQTENNINQITVHFDQRVANLIEIEKRTDKIMGYRLQICLDSDKEIVDEARDKYLKLYPLTDTYVNFENPHFNLKVGDFRSRVEAEKIKREIFGEFVICIIHEELINLPRID
jgi:hypothetical protein